MGIKFSTSGSLFYGFYNFYTICKHFASSYTFNSFGSSFEVEWETISRGVGTLFTGILRNTPAWDYLSLRIIN